MDTILDINPQTSTSQVFNSSHLSGRIQTYLPNQSECAIIPLYRYLEELEKLCKKHKIDYKHLGFDVLIAA